MAGKRARRDVCGKLLGEHHEGEFLADFCGEPQGHGTTGPSGLVGSDEHVGKWNGHRWRQTPGSPVQITSRQPELPDHKTAEAGEAA